MSFTVKVFSKADVIGDVQCGDGVKEHLIAQK
jgi:hypothetical protein